MSQGHMVCCILTIQPAKLAPVLVLPALAVATHSVLSLGDVLAECLDNSDCAGHKTCSAGNCIDPCVGVCGANANCETRNHVPVCSCPAGFTGDPFTGCRRFDPGAVSSKSLWDQHEL
ncbi:unnamed protein product [Callosobruchus maculatus]|uniref:EGF-like domain-containing protein n=1 Tax=Callosobruchus maculatus TaxID=64391 RepID=A0A653BDP6_CALMS|nr:unnamed protein product [Callosobruchus maculatus]